MEVAVAAMDKACTTVVLSCKGSDGRVSSGNQWGCNWFAHSRFKRCMRQGAACKHTALP